MNGRIAKQLRKDAFDIARDRFHKTSSEKVSRNKQQYWQRYSPKAIYKSLKKAYYSNTAPEF